MKNNSLQALDIVWSPDTGDGGPTSSMLPDCLCAGKMAGRAGSMCPSEGNSQMCMFQVTTSMNSEAGGTVTSITPKRSLCDGQWHSVTGMALVTFVHTRKPFNLCLNFSKAAPVCPLGGLGWARYYNQTPGFLTRFNPTVFRLFHSFCL